MGGSQRACCGDSCFLVLRRPLARVFRASPVPLYANALFKRVSEAPACKRPIHAGFRGGAGKHPIHTELRAALLKARQFIAARLCRRQGGKQQAVHTRAARRANAVFWQRKPLGGLAFHPVDKRLPLLQIFSDAGGQQIKQRHAVGGSLNIQLRIT